MNIEISRRHFLKLAGAGAAGSAITAFGFGEAEAQVAAYVRPFKLASATETRNTCPYCSVACGVIMYSRGDLKKGERADIFHIEGDSDHPTNRGTLCPKGAATFGLMVSPERIDRCLHRAPGATGWREVELDWAMERIAQLTKRTRDESFVTCLPDGTRVNHTLAIGSMGGATLDNEENYLIKKLFSAGLGMVFIENQARV